jgi:hypothetical protein
MTDQQAWELAERMNARAPEGVRYEVRRTSEPTAGQRKPRQARLGGAAGIGLT